MVILTQIFTTLMINFILNKKKIIGPIKNVRLKNVYHEVLNDNLIYIILAVTCHLLLLVPQRFERVSTQNSTKEYSLLERICKIFVHPKNFADIKEIYISMLSILILLISRDRS